MFSGPGLYSSFINVPQDLQESLLTDCGDKGKTNCQYTWDRGRCESGCGIHGN